MKQELSFTPDVGTCPHPIESIRLDGIWRIQGEPRAAVTCERCCGSFSLRVRADFATELANAITLRASGIGALAHAGGGA